MSSRGAEDVHSAALRRLLAEHGVVCDRSPSGSTEPEGAPEEDDQEEKPEAQSEHSPEEMLKEEEEEEAEKEIPYFFPTPSLRMILPDSLRRVQMMNRIHVLPEEFNKSIDPDDIPRIYKTPQKTYIDVLGAITGCRMYKDSLAEYWFLDTLANLLRRAQTDHLDKKAQAVLIHWFCEWIKEMQHFDAADRRRMMRRFEDNMLSAAGFVAAKDYLPVPDEVDVGYKDSDTAPPPAPAADSSPRQLADSQAFCCSLADLMRIIHYIYDQFSTDYQYNLVRSVFTLSPDYQHIDSPFQMQQPKSLYTVLKTKPKKEKTPRKEKTSAKKGKAVEAPPTQEYLALMEFIEKEAQILDEQEDLDREAWHKKSHILPLAHAATDELFDKYWPPPPEPSPPPEPEALHKEKKHGKK